MARVMQGSPETGLANDAGRISILDLSHETNFGRRIVHGIHRPSGDVSPQQCKVVAAAISGSSGDVDYVTVTASQNKVGDRLRRAIYIASPAIVSSHPYVAPQVDDRRFRWTNIHKNYGCSNLIVSGDDRTLYQPNYDARPMRGEKLPLRKFKLILSGFPQGISGAPQRQSEEREEYGRNSDDDALIRVNEFTLAFDEDHRTFRESPMHFWGRLALIGIGVLLMGISGAVLIRRGKR